MTVHKLKCAVLAVFASAVGAAFGDIISSAGEKLVSAGQTVVFLGDSITHYGVKNPYGYVQLVVKGLSANGIELKWFGAGIPGNKALHMNARFDKDVLARKPDLVTISAGVNDVWFAGPDCTLEKYRVDMEQMIERGKAAGVKVVLLTPTTAMGEFNNPNIVKYAECVRELAAKHGLVVADTWKAVRGVIDDPAGAKLVPRGLKATADGVHMAPSGDRAMARCVLRAFGLGDGEMAKAEKVWNEGVSLCTLKSCVGVPLKTYRALEAEADARACKIEAVYREIFRKGVEVTLAGAALEEPKTSFAAPCKPDGQKPEIAVIGDYFHYVDQQSRSGLVNFIRRAIDATGKDLAVFAEPQFRGGTTALNGYWDKTLANRKIAYLVVTTGSYDAWNNDREKFPALMKQLAEKATKAGTKVVFLTTRPVRSNVSDPFNAALQAMADGKSVFVLDQLAIDRAELKRRAANKEASICSAGYPLNPQVNFLLGKALLPLLGFGEKEIEKVVARIEALPDFADTDAVASVSFAEYDRLLDLARKENVPLSEICQKALVRGVKTTQLCSCPREAD